MSNPNTITMLTTIIADLRAIATQSRAVHGPEDGTAETYERAARLERAVDGYVASVVELGLGEHETDEATRAIAWAWLRHLDELAAERRLIAEIQAQVAARRGGA